MRHKLVIATAARADIREIYLFVASDSPQAAERLFNQIDDAISDLAFGPLQFPTVADRPETGLRRRVVGSYNVFYRFADGVVSVVRVLHGARDATSLLFPFD